MERPYCKPQSFPNSRKYCICGGVIKKKISVNYEDVRTRILVKIKYSSKNLVFFPKHSWHILKKMWSRQCVIEVSQVTSLLIATFEMTVIVEEVTHILGIFIEWLNWLMPFISISLSEVSQFYFIFFLPTVLLYDIIIRWLTTLLKYRKLRKLLLSYQFNIISWQKERSLSLNSWVVSLAQ